ncbi:uncharacterized protein [Diadema setosum]|uniref:uncharacterized protein n=1 Tax=Diadema setosum TaxID=31175 RepID=UPI003B3A5522
MAVLLQLMFPSSSRIFTSRSQETTSEDSTCQYSGLLQHFLKNEMKCLITGDKESGKTALLFQCAVSCAHDGHRVAFITPTKFKSLPPSVEGAPPQDPLLMKQINIMYFQDRTSILTYLSRIHTLSSHPDVIIVDNLDFYASHPQASDITFTVSTLCAYLVDAATFISSKRNDGEDLSSKGLVMASVSSPTQGQLPGAYVYSKFLPREFKLSGVDPQNNVFQLTTQGDGFSQADCIITYQLGATIKVLDILTGEETGSFSQLTNATSQGGDEVG